MIGFAAPDLILRRVGRGAMRVALVVEVARMNPDDRAADVTGFRVPLDPITDLEFFSHFLLRLKGDCGRFQVDPKPPFITHEHSKCFTDEVFWPCWPARMPSQCVGNCQDDRPGDRLLRSPARLASPIAPIVGHTARGKGSVVRRVGASRAARRGSTGIRMTRVERPPVYTVGHSTRSIAEFVDLLKQGR